MDESGLLLCLISCGFTFVLGWLIGIERKNKLTKDLEFWQAYARELKEDVTRAELEDLSHITNTNKKQ